jgi:hypothetical protein
VVKGRAYELETRLIAAESEFVLGVRRDEQRDALRDEVQLGVKSGAALKPSADAAETWLFVKRHESTEWTRVNLERTDEGLLAMSNSTRVSLGNASTVVLWTSDLSWPDTMRIFR